MTVGVPSLVLLYCTLGAIGVTVIVKTGTSPDLAYSPRAKVRFYLMALSALALPFFVWAVVNTLRDDAMDYGVVSIGLVLVAAAAALCLGADGSRYPWLSGAAVPAACVAVAANYAYALAVVTSPATFVAYAASGLVVWLLAAGAGAYLTRKHTAAVAAGGIYQHLALDDDCEGYE